nr:leucine-rich repeat domain-containing protein [Mycoplasmopsis bovis]
MKVLSGFSGKSSEIKEVVLPESLEIIGNSTFNFNEHITSVKLPSKLIEVSGFSSTNIRELDIPESVIKLGGFNQTLIRNLKLPDNLESFEGFHESKIKKLVFPKFLRFADISKSHWKSLETIDVYSKYLVKSKWWDNMKEDDYNQLIKLVDKTNSRRDK